tara:strand:+ start:394 stop:723 length:330 start_codon:yes stop_codon:yes gene_type:complete
MSRFSERRWSILPNSSISDVDFSQVLEVNSEHVITNVSGSLSVVKWDGSSVMPASVKAIEGRVSSSQDVHYFSSESIDITASGISGSFTHEEILTVIAGREWISPDTEQ